MLTNTAGAVAATYTYNAEGRLTAKTGTAANSFLFAGSYIDSESGFAYLRARSYDPVTAQFISRDPLFPVTRQAYVYVRDNPKNWADPTGLSCGVANPFVPDINPYGPEYAIITGTRGGVNVAGSALTGAGASGAIVNVGDGTVAVVGPESTGIYTDPSGAAAASSGQGGVGSAALGSTDVAAISTTKGGVNVAGSDNADVAVISSTKGGVNASSPDATADSGITIDVD